MERYEMMIHNVIRQFSNLDRDTQEDIEQELRFFIYQNQKKFEHEALELDQFMFIVLKRKVINLLKHSKYKKHYSLNKVTESGNEYIDLMTAPNLIDEQQISETLVWNYINEQLEQQERDIIMAYFYQEKTYQSIGKNYGVSADTIRRRLQKIIHKIRKWWQ